MNILLKYKSYIFSGLILVGIGYFMFLHVTPDAPIIKATPLLSGPASYEATIIQTGGIGSQATTAHVVDLGSATYSPQGNCNGYLSPANECYTYLNPPENYMSVSFKSAGDLSAFGGEPNWVATSTSMWAYCQDGYVVKGAQSPTNNPLDTYLMGVPKYGVGMEVLAKPNNTIQITCEKQAVSK